MVRKFKGDGGTNPKGKRTSRGSKSKRRDKSITSNRPCGKKDCSTCFGYIKHEVK